MAHDLVNPDGLMRPRGFSHAVIAAAGRTVYLAGQAGFDASGKLVGEGLLEQFEASARNVVLALEGAGAAVEHLVSMQIFVTDAQEYADNREEIGEIYRKHLGRHYPAAALFEVGRMFSAGSKVELCCIAVIPDGADPA